MVYNIDMVKSKLNGLILSGGKSSRMGHDKGLIDWWGKPHKYFLADLVSPYCDDVYLSCRSDEKNSVRGDYNYIVDTNEFSDSYGAIVSALSQYKDTAQLVIACDMPFITREAIEYLIRMRDASKIATTYQSPDSGLPEPMFTIWEPSSLEALRKLAKQGIDCPRKALIISKQYVKHVKPLDKQIITNVNTPEEALKAREKINAR
jgi:molybdopterin-guanine dinucleotide biosynthesis protein A